MKLGNCNYFVLCEDKRHFHFVRSFLKAHGVDKLIDPLFGLPEGSGSGAQHVDKNFEDAVQYVKRRKAKNVLLVMRDADNESVSNVESRFNGLMSHDVNFQHFLIIPKRNIETWFYFLDKPFDETSANEEIDRKNDYRGVKPSKYGNKMATHVFSDEQHVPDSLKQTCARICA